jgi:hypothetical protein
MRERRDEAGINRSGDPRPGDVTAISVQRKACERYDFALLAASFLHSERNFLRSLPFRPLASASLEHSSDSAERGLAIFLSAGAAASDLAAGGDGHS